MKNRVDCVGCDDIKKCSRCGAKLCIKHDKHCAVMKHYKTKKVQTCSVCWK